MPFLSTTSRMMLMLVTAFSSLWLGAWSFPLCTASLQRSTSAETSTTALGAMETRRSWLQGGIVSAAALGAGLLSSTAANGQVFMDPAQYGDQELRVGAVDSLKESVRREILKNPALAPSFFQLSLLDALSYNAATQEFGPDGRVMLTVLTSKQTDTYTKNLQQAALALIDAAKTLKRKTAITIADAVAIGGAEAIESIGGPSMTIQLGRADTPRNLPPPPLPINLFSGDAASADVIHAFKNAGMTDREMTALLSGLLTLEMVEKSRTSEDWRAAARPKFREAGKIGRMSEFKPITDEDIAQAELEEDPEYEDPDAGWYISDSFGTKENRFGDRIGKEDISEKNFNKYIVELTNISGKKKKKSGEDAADSAVADSWVAQLLIDPANPTCQTWLNKYAGANINYLKDLNISFNSLTQLGAVYTGGKYESLLKNRPRKSLNDDELNLF